MFPVTSISDRPKSPGPAGRGKSWARVVSLCVAGIPLVFSALGPDHYATPAQQRQAERRYDKKRILRQAEPVTDRSGRFIRVPEDYPEVKDFDVAREAPTVDFAVIQGLEPFYLPSLDPRKGGVYGGWGDVTRGPDGCFYFSIGNHMAYGGTAYILKYDPASKRQSIVIDLQKVAGYGDDVFGDAKFHGNPDIGPDGEMWLLSNFGPTPTPEELNTTYRGGWLIRYNVLTGETESCGVPVRGESWPYHAYDGERGLLFAVGAIKNYVLAFDTRARRPLYASLPKDGISWYERGILLDRETGVFYSTDTRVYPGGSLLERVRGEHRFVSYERSGNTFRRMAAVVPPNPVTGVRTPLRAHTNEKDAGGAFWCADMTGGFFRFFPAEDRVEPLGIVTWGREGKYLANLCFSPRKRYIYYLPGADTQADAYGTPVVQLDTLTKRKKVIVFLNDFYLDKYGYSPGGTYGLELSGDGASLFFYANGQFTTKRRRSGYGRPALFMVHIPESERRE